MKMNDYFARMKTVLGEDYDRFLETVDKPAYKAIRVNTLKMQPEELLPLLSFAGGQVPFAETGYYVDVDKLGKHPLHHAGAFYVQEPSAMSAVTALRVRPGDKVLDLCAAPGGKSTQIAAELSGTGLLWANEIVRPRAHILLSNIERMGVKNAVVSNMAPETLCTRLEGFFDKVLVDAPCSGEGMFRKDKEAIYEWSVEHSLSCAERQKAIMDCAAKAVRPEGEMVYSTCTFSPDENEGVVRHFLKEHPEFELIDTGCRFGTPTLDYAIRIYPFHGGEGHFVAKFRKKKGRAYKGDMFRYTEPTREERLEIERFIADILRNVGFRHYHVIDERILNLPDTELLPGMEGMNILRAGVKLGDFKKNRIEPHHNLATSLTPYEFKRRLIMDCEDTICARYISGEELEIDHWINGWGAATVNGITLGLGKAVDGHLKNKYPKGLRTLAWKDLQI
ncbi:MAG: RsmF rRNA methyltransferase first C-terminal domain-containing protein [Ruminococcus sp.]|nr:RsmF rRNA methyltransferase first C-terminal domain-containing protein [Ruminococcus sp.]